MDRASGIGNLLRPWRDLCVDLFVKEVRSPKKVMDGFFTLVKEALKFYEGLPIDKTDRQREPICPA